MIRVADALSCVVAQHNRYETDGRYVPLAGMEEPDQLVVVRSPTTILELAGRFPNAERFLWLHDYVIPGSRERIELGRTAPELERLGVTVICVSDYLRRDVMRVFTEALGRAPQTATIVRIHNPVPDDLRPTPTSSFDRTKLVWCSSPNKGLDIALAAFQWIHGRRPELRLHVANPGYFDLPARLPSGTVRLGSLSHARVQEEIASALCVFYPNFAFPETFGLVFAESNALGTPVLTHGIGAAEEVLGSDTGQLLPMSRRLRATYAVAGVAPKGKRAVIRAGASLGAFQPYLRTIEAWAAGARPIVRARPEFRLSAIAAEWRSLLTESVEPRSAITAGGPAPESA